MSWLKSFLSSSDGQGSSKRLKSFILCLLVVYIVARGMVNTNIHLYSLYALIMAILLLDTVITVQDIIALKNGTSATPPASVIKEGDKVEISKTD